MIPSHPFRSAVANASPSGEGDGIAAGWRLERNDPSIRRLLSERERRQHDAVHLGQSNTAYTRGTPFRRAPSLEALEPRNTLRVEGHHLAVQHEVAGKAAERRDDLGKSAVRSIAFGSRDGPVSRLVRASAR